MIKQTDFWFPWNFIVPNREQWYQQMGLIRLITCRQIDRHLASRVFKLMKRLHHIEAKRATEEKELWHHMFRKAAIGHFGLSGLQVQRGG